MSPAGDGGGAEPSLLASSTTTPLTKPTHKPKRLFEPQSSPLDSESLGNLWGFVNLFWIAISWYGARTVWANYQETGLPFDLRILLDLGVKLERLFVSDLFMVLSLFICVPLEKAQIAGYISRPLGILIQHVYQTLFFFFWTLTIWWSEWTFFQSGILAMHMLTMLMKVHSYLTTNRELASKQAELTVLKKRVEAIDSGTPGEAVKAKETPSKAKANGKASHVEEPAVDIVALRDQISELESQLYPIDGTPYPRNVTFSNFIDFLRIPVLVYTLSYPRTKKIRWSYVAEKIAGFFGTIVLCYVVIATFIHPVLQEANKLPVLEMIGRLLFPMLIVYILIFLMVWEYITNVFAELSRFADRGFYSDWWNSTDFFHFSRTWNKPVYTFLLHHVYKDQLKSGASKMRAALLTFLLSSVLHEVVLTLVTKRFRPVLFFFQMSQLPLTYIGNLPPFKRIPRFTNALWWAGMAIGFPLISVFYLIDFTKMASGDRSIWI